jgi:uncharacterized protein YqhQ
MTIQNNESVKPTANQPEIHKSKIGGQALFEGIMMRGIDKEAMAVRKKDGSIHVETIDLPPNKWYRKTPFVRGVFNFVLQMKNGYKYLMKSMEISGFLDEDGEAPAGNPPAAVDEPAQAVKILEETGMITDETAETTTSTEGESGKKIVGKFGETLIGILGIVGGIALSVFMFMYLPAWGFTAFSKLFESDISRFQSLFEGIIRIILFVVYMWAVSLMKEIGVTYQYHGAEHKTIAAYEAGEELDPENVENIKKYTRFHPRCGTSFVFLMLAVSILFYSLLQFFLPVSSQDIAEWLQVNNIVANLIRTGVKLLCLPFLVAISYEIIKLAGKYDRNIIMRVISAPGLSMQRLTTKEPDERQLQVAVAAMLPVIPENKEEDKW